MAAQKIVKLEPTEGEDEESTGSSRTLCAPHEAAQETQERSQTQTKVSFQTCSAWKTW